jgi:hypothetical protein
MDGKDQGEKRNGKMMDILKVQDLVGRMGMRA